MGGSISTAPPTTATSPAATNHLASRKPGATGTGGTEDRPGQLFESKDELLAASLKERASAYVATLLPPADGGRSPRERILYVFEQVEVQAEAPEFQGCRYLAVQIELKDQSHPASRVAHQVKENLTAFFRAEAEQGGADDPDLLARQLSLVFDGASARAGIQADTLTGLITPTVTTLLDTAGVR
ncbi:TetR/AcrR family transcriptional regulator [Streptomyces sviceus]|uniref:TetR/AcrR family transcriptional regulator n=1 Tax=Streptomyces sviceus TaxID=285530 RepID=UPI00368E06C5